MDDPITARGLAALISRVSSTTSMMRHGATYMRLDGQDSAVLLRKGFLDALKSIEEDVGELLSLIPDQAMPEPEAEAEPEPDEKGADDE